MRIEAEELVRIPDAQLIVLVRTWQAQGLRTMLARGAQVAAVGTLFGAFIATALSDPQQGWIGPVADALLFGASLVVFWFPLALVTLMLGRKIDRFDRKVRGSIERRRAARRSVLATIGLLGLAFVVLIPGLSRSLGTDAIARSAWMGGIGIVTLGILFQSWISPETRPIDWSQSRLCRRCGYDRSDQIITCPECGEEATLA